MNERIFQEYGVGEGKNHHVTTTWLFPTWKMDADLTSSSNSYTTSSSSVCLSSGSESNSAISDPTPSILNRLKSPKLSEVARPRKIKTNTPPVGLKRSTGQSKFRSYMPKSISPIQQVREFPNDSFTVSAGKLFCNPCREEIGTKLSVIRLHVKSKKHVSGKEHVKQRKVRDIDIAEVLKPYNENEHLVGETLSATSQVYRIKVVRTFLKAGVPLNKLDQFRPLLEENGTRLAGRMTMSDFIPFIHQQEVKTTEDEIAGRYISIIFDGTTRMGEAVGIVVQYVDDDWHVQQRLIRLQLLAKSLCAEELAREIISTLQVHYKVASESLLGAMHDRAPVTVRL